MNKRNLTKKNILERVSSKFLFDFYLRPYHLHQNLRQGQNISNPFLVDKQHTPSFNIYEPKGSESWKFHDFATGDHGDIFNLIMRLKKVGFRESLKIINDDHCLNLKN